MMLIIVRVLTIHVLRVFLLNIKNGVKDVLFSFKSMPNQMMHIRSSVGVHVFYRYNSLLHFDNQKSVLNNYHQVHLTLIRNILI